MKKKEYRYIARNTLPLFYFSITLFFAFIICMIFTFKFHNVLGMIISYLIFFIDLGLFLYFIISGKIGLVKVDQKGVSLREKAKRIFIPWGEFTDVKKELFYKTRDDGEEYIYKLTLCIDEKTYNIYTTRHFVSIIIEYCSSDELLEKLKTIRAEMDNVEVEI